MTARQEIERLSKLLADNGIDPGESVERVKLTHEERSARIRAGLARRTPEQAAATNALKKESQRRHHERVRRALALLAEHEAAGRDTA